MGTKIMIHYEKSIIKIQEYAIYCISNEQGLTEFHRLFSRYFTDFKQMLKKISECKTSQTQAEKQLAKCCIVSSWITAEKII